jgi:molybdopterin synthase sulfur carrier subunit
MTVNILYFAALRDALGCGDETLTLPKSVTTLGELRAYLAGRGEQWAPLAATKNVRMARNQRMVKADEPLTDGDEIAFFPPVTGG